MNKISIALFLVLCIASFNLAYSQCSDWNLPSEFIDPSTNPITDECNNDIWYLYQQDSAGNYTLLSTYSPSPTYPALKGWKGTDSGFPDISKNFGKTIKNIDGRGVDFRRGTMEIHPGPNTSGVVAWKSPFSGAVELTVSVIDNNITCGNGVRWNVAHNSLTIAEGLSAITLSTIAYSNSQLEVAQGDFIYFAIHNNGDHGCDATGIEIQINKPVVCAAN